MASDCYLAVINAGLSAVLCIVLYVVEYVDYVAGGQKMVCQVMWRGNARNDKQLAVSGKNTWQNFKPFTNFHFKKNFFKQKKTHLTVCFLIYLLTT